MQGSLDKEAGHTDTTSARQQTAVKQAIFQY